MKKYLMTMAAVATIFAGCGKSDDGGTNTPPQPNPDKPERAYATF